MRYTSSGAFRQALEDRLRTESLDTGAPLVRLRKMVAFERFLARLIADRPGAWLLRGGLALQWRLGARARTTQDLDMLLLGSAEDLHAILVRAALLDLGDWFRCLVQHHEPGGPHSPPQPGAMGGQEVLAGGETQDAIHCPGAGGGNRGDVATPSSGQVSEVRPATALQLRQDIRPSGSSARDPKLASSRCHTKKAATANTCYGCYADRSTAPSIETPRPVAKPGSASCLTARC